MWSRCQTFPEPWLKIEALFHINEGYNNVYDPDEVKVDAVVTFPGGDTMQVPCFYYVDVYNEDGEWLQNPEFQCWMLRFMSEREGTHSLKLKILDGDGYSETNSYDFEVAAGDNKGVIRADTVNRQYFRHSTGEPFYPLGINIGWNSIENYTQIINNLSQGNANIFRYWLAPFRVQALEWSSGGWAGYDGLDHHSRRPFRHPKVRTITAEPDDHDKTLRVAGGLIGLS